MINNFSPDWKLYHSLLRISTMNTSIFIANKSVNLISEKYLIKATKLTRLTSKD